MFSDGSQCGFRRKMSMFLHRPNFPKLTHVDIYTSVFSRSSLIHCLDRTPDCTILGTGLLLPRWRTGKPSRGRYLFYNHFISILIVIQYQRPDLRTLYAFLQSSLVSLSQKSHRYGYGGIISSPFVYILIF